MAYERAVTPRVLLTGFPPLGGQNENFADKGRFKIDAVGIVDMELQTLLLTCDEAGSEHVASLIRDGGRFDAIIHLGLAESRSAISLERCGQNESRFRMADNSGRVAQGLVIEGGPARLVTTASVHVLDEEFEHESDIACSDSAVAFFCYETIYRTLEAIDSVSAKTSDGRALPAIFIHLPPESEVSLERQVDVVRRVVLALASKPRLEVVGALIFDAEGRILACRRPPEDVWGGWWEFPGGKVDAGERPREALVREIAEELQLDVVPERIVASLNHEYDDRHVSLDIWNCGVIEPKSVNPIDHADVRWRDSASLDSVKSPPADQPLTPDSVVVGLHHS